MSDYPMLISNKLHSFRNFYSQCYYCCISGRLLSLIVNGCKPLSTVRTMWQKTSSANSPRQKYVSKICGNLGSIKKQPKSVNF